VVIAILAGVWIAALFAAHNAGTATVRLPGLGVTLQLGENEGGKGKEGRERDDD